ncbi:flagellar hook capping FlgD N-terminal domain-containing protein [Xylophilus sp. GW821-FHT01B05]
METTSSTASLASSNATATAVSANSSAGMSDMFLKLLVAQIKNQNPLEPTDPSEFVTQLNQLSQTEALQQLVSQNSATSSMLFSLQVLAMGNQVGSTVTVKSSSVKLSDQVVQASATLDTNTSDLTLVLTGSDGQVHRTSLGPRAAGKLTFDIDPVTLGLPAGEYGLGLETAEGTTLSAEVTGKITGLRFAADGSPVVDVTSAGTVTTADITGFLGRSS